MSKTTTITNWLADKPKLAGLLWTMLLLVFATGNVSAGYFGAIIGP